MLPDSNTKQLYNDMLGESDPTNKLMMQEKLRPLAVPGSIDVNIMVKVNRMKYNRGDRLAIRIQRRT